jgi:hypothetical protein
MQRLTSNLVQGLAAQVYENGAVVYVYNGQVITTEQAVQLMATPISRLPQRPVHFSQVVKSAQDDGSAYVAYNGTIVRDQNQMPQMLFNGKDA